MIKEGHSDFQFEEGKKILIDAKKTVAFPITFNSRISKRIRGKLIFANCKEEGT